MENIQLIDLVAQKSILKARKSILNYLAGYNKILLQYKPENEAILIENASSIIEGISKNLEKIYLIKWKTKNRFRNKKEEEELFKLLLSKEKIETMNLDQYKNSNSDINLEIEDIFKEEIASYSSSKKLEESNEFQPKARGFYRKFWEKTEDKKEKEIIKEKQMETHKEEKKEEKNPSVKKKRFHRSYQSQESTIEKNPQEDAKINQDNYNETSLNTTIEEENSKPTRILGRKYGYFQKKSTDNFSETKKDLNSSIKSNVISSQEKEKENEIKKLKEELEKLKLENKNLKNSNLDMTKSKNDYEKLNNDSDKKLKEKEKEIKKINSDNNKETQKLKNELNNVKEELNNVIKNKEESIKKYKEQEKNYLSKINEYEINKKKNQDLQKKIDNLEKENKDLLKKNKDSEKERSEIQNKLNDKIKEIDKLNKENQNLKENEKEFNKKIKELEKEILNKEKDYKNQISKLEKENRESISRIGLDLEDKIKYNEELIKENKKLKDNEKNNLKLIKDYEINEKNYLSKIKEYETELKQKEKIINNFDKENKELLEKNEDLETKNSEIQNTLNNEIAEGDKLYDENQDLKKQVEEFNKTLKELEKKIKDNEKEYKKNIDKLEKENKQSINQIETELDDKANNIKKITKENEKLKENEKKYLKQIKDYELNEKNYITENKDLQNNLTKSEKKLNEIKNSYSEIIAEKDQLMEENDLLKNQLKQKNDNNNNKLERKEKEINEKILFLENKEMEIDNELKNIEITKQELEKVGQQLEQERKNINNNPNQFANINKSNLNFNNNFSFNNINNDKNINMNNPMIVMNNMPIMPIPPAQPKINNFMGFNNNSQNQFNNNNIIQPKPVKIDDSPISKYSQPTLIGLNNIGATCYLNSTLQCLSQTRALTNYFLIEKNKTKIINNNIAQKNRNDLQLSPAYLELIENLWDKQKMNKSYSPNKFMTTIEAMNPLFKKGQAGDSKDFIIFILEQIHRELKKPNKINIEPKEPLNQYDRDNAFNHFFYDFQNELSIISDMFFGLNETTNICLFCKNNYNSKNLQNPICYNYGIFNVLIFPLEEVKNMKYGSIRRNNFLANNNIVNLYDCFLYNQKTDLFCGENKNYCNICKQLWDSQYTSVIYSSPNILVLILNRGKNNIYKVKIDFPETIDISQFVVRKDGPLIYNLYGVITHLGESGPNAHFVATCKSPVDKFWYRYNDAMVSPISNFQKDIIDFGTPYILFYEQLT